MPNYCKNILIVNGPSELIDGFARHVTGEYGNFDFNTVMPYPSHFKAMDDSCAKADKDGTRLHGMKDGYNSGGYEWCVRNWGTKWNAGNAENIKCSLGTLFIFETAWGPPIGVVREMAIRFPALSFELHYFERGMGRAGVWSRGEVEEDGIVPKEELSEWTNYCGMLGG